MPQLVLFSNQLIRQIYKMFKCKEIIYVSHLTRKKLLQSEKVMFVQMYSLYYKMTDCQLLPVYLLLNSKITNFLNCLGGEGELRGVKNLF